jgi:hypothetical protein
MKRLLEFTTTLDRATIIKILQQNTFATENDFQTLLRGKHYFSGQVNNKKIRLKNATRRPGNPSPILDIQVFERNNLTQILILDDTDDEIKLNSQVVLTITIPITIAILLVGGVSSLYYSDIYIFLWCLVPSLATLGIGFLRISRYKKAVRVNTRYDINFLIRLLKR